MRPKKAFSQFGRTDLPDDWFSRLKIQNPKLWKKIKGKFDTGRQIVEVQLFNCLDRLNEKTLRLYLRDFAKRFLKYGPNSFPTSFNVIEPFFSFNQENSILQLVDEEESYGVSLYDFLDFVTDSNFDLDEVDLFENIDEGLIYNFSFSSDFDSINFSNDKGGTFIIGGLSLIRQDNEVSIIMQAGESYDKEYAKKHFEKQTRKSVKDSISPFKRSLGFELDEKGEPEVVHFEGREDLWLHSVGVLFDIETKSIDIRHVARDENLIYQIITDDFDSFFSRETNLTKEDFDRTTKHHLNELSKYDAVFDFAKYCLALPYYIFENEQKLVDVIYETSLTELLSGPLTKRKFKSVPSRFKVFAKPLFYLESTNQKVIEKKELSESRFHVKRSGYWKRIGFNEEGFDKKGRNIVGKTWVETNESYYTSPKGVTTVYEKEYFKTENAGYLYVMRQPTLEENIFKVGLTRRTPEQRSKELNKTGSPDNFFVVNSYYTKDCIWAESQVHEKLKEFRLSDRREFFRCDLKYILDTCEKVTDEINKG